MVSLEEWIALHHTFIHSSCFTACTTLSNGGFSLSSLGDLPRYFGFDPSGTQSSGENTDAPCIGSDVMIHNIEKHPEFNGQQGKILSYAAEKQRYVIEFGENRDKKVALKPKNLKPLHILLGRFYMIDGLKNSSQYNGINVKYWRLTM